MPRVASKIAKWNNSEDVVEEISDESDEENEDESDENDLNVDCVDENINRMEIDEDNENNHFFDSILNSEANNWH